MHHPKQIIFCLFDDEYVTLPPFLNCKKLCECWKPNLECCVPRKRAHTLHHNEDACMCTQARSVLASRQETVVRA